ncbi:MAG TPA: ankyrin repeat domain-containing protein [Gammaproteobacteria bacterium]|nr:ankyrin repeat domain-containing protein [Gammaproteobacteria bacterium]
MFERIQDEAIQQQCMAVYGKAFLSSQVGLDGYFKAVKAVLGGSHTAINNKILLDCAIICNQPVSILDDELKEDENQAFNLSYALTTAAGVGRMEWLAYLVEKGANVNYQYSLLGSTPLMVAVKFNQVAVVEFLLSNGANVYIKRTNNEDALTIAKDIGNPKMLEMLDKHLNRLKLEQYIRSKQVTADYKEHSFLGFKFHFPGISLFGHRFHFGRYSKGEKLAAAHALLNNQPLKKHMGALESGELKSIYHRFQKFRKFRK